MVRVELALVVVESRVASAASRLAAAAVVVAIDTLIIVLDPDAVNVRVTDETGTPSEAAIAPATAALFAES